MTFDDEPAKGGRLALDIETISPTVAYDEYPDFDDPTDFELLATALLYEPPDGDLDDAVAAVLWREGIDATGEAEHGQAVADAVASVAPSEIVTYNGDRFDLWLLRHRTEIAGRALGDTTAFSQLEAALNGPAHLDLKHSAWDAYGEYTSLEETVDYQGLDVRRTYLDEYDHGHSLSYRSPTKPPHVGSSDVPEIGEALLRTRAGEESSVNPGPTREMLEHYALGDIEHLLALADRHPF